MRWLVATSCMKAAPEGGPCTASVCRQSQPRDTDAAQYVEVRCLQVLSLTTFLPILIAVNLYRVVSSTCTTLSLRLAPCCRCRCCCTSAGVAAVRALLPLGSRGLAAGTAPAGCGVWLLLWLLLSGAPGDTV